MKKVIFILAMLVVCLSASAQKDLDAVYLKNGSIVVGRIVDQNESIVAIVISGGSKFVFQMAEVSTIAKEVVKGLEIDKASKKGDLVNKQKGFVSYSDISFLIGSDQFYVPVGFSVRSANGYKFNRYLYAAGSLCISFYEGLATTGYAARLGGDLGKGPILPYYYVEAGYATPWSDGDQNWREQKGGEIFRTGAGFRFLTRGPTSITLGLGYSHQQIKFITRSDWPVPNTRTQIVDYNRLEISIGVSF